MSLGNGRTLGAHRSPASQSLFRLENGSYWRLKLQQLVFPRYELIGLGEDPGQNIVRTGVGRDRPTGTVAGQVKAHDLSITSICKSLHRSATHAQNSRRYRNSSGIFASASSRDAAVTTTSSLPSPPANQAEES